jgi:hypothetical protein
MNVLRQQSRSIDDHRLMNHDFWLHLGSCFNLKSMHIMMILLIFYNLIVGLGQLD